MKFAADVGVRGREQNIASWWFDHDRRLDHAVEHLWVVTFIFCAHGLSFCATHNTNQIGCADQYLGDG